MRRLLALACFVQFIGIFCDTRVSREYLSFVVSVQLNGSHVCSGSIYSLRNVLTSAECLLDVDPQRLEDLTIRVGNISDFESPENTYAVKKISHPPGYHKNFGKSAAHNLALIRLVEPIEPRGQIPGDVRHDHMSQFSFANEKTTGRPKSIMGWQMTETGLRLISHRWNFISKGDCAKKMGLPNLMEDVLCARVGEKNLPNEFFGGPAMDRKQQMGVTLWSANYNEQESLVLYTDIAPNSQWLKDALL